MGTTLLQPSASFDRRRPSSSLPSKALGCGPLRLCGRPRPARCEGAVGGPGRRRVVPPQPDKIVFFHQHWCPLESQQPARMPALQANLSSSHPSAVAKTLALPPPPPPLRSSADVFPRKQAPATIHRRPAATATLPGGCGLNAVGCRGLLTYFGPRLFPRIPRSTFGSPPISKMPCIIPPFRLTKRLASGTWDRWRKSTGCGATWPARRGVGVPPSVAPAPMEFPNWQFPVPSFPPARLVPGPRVFFNHGVLY